MGGAASRLRALARSGAAANKVEAKRLTEPPDSLRNLAEKARNETFRERFAGLDAEGVRAKRNATDMAEGVSGRTTPRFTREPRAVHAKHILLRTRAAAERVRKQLLENSADFAALARKQSICASAKDGGNLGWLERGAVVAALEDVLFGSGKESEELRKGRATIVRTRFGYHVVLVDEEQVGREEVGMTDDHAETLKRLAGAITSKPEAEALAPNALSQRRQRMKLAGGKSPQTFTDAKPREGYLNFEQVLSLLQLYAIDREEWNVERLSKKFKVSEEHCALLLRYMSNVEMREIGDSTIGLSSSAAAEHDRRKNLVQTFDALPVSRGESIKQSAGDPSSSSRD